VRGIEGDNTSYVNMSTAHHTSYLTLPDHFSSQTYLEPSLQYRHALSNCHWIRTWDVSLRNDMIDSHITYLDIQRQSHRPQACI